MWLGDKNESGVYVHFVEWLQTAAADVSVNDWLETYLSLLTVYRQSNYTECALHFVIQDTQTVTTLLCFLKLWLLMMYGSENESLRFHTAQCCIAQSVTWKLVTWTWNINIDYWDITEKKHDKLTYMEPIWRYTVNTYISWASNFHDFCSLSRIPN